MAADSESGEPADVAEAPERTAPTPDAPLLTFLKRHGLARTEILDVLTGPEYQIASLYDLRVISGQPRLLRELRDAPALTANKVSQAALARLTAEVVDNAVHYHEHPGAEASAEALSAFLTDTGVLEDQRNKDTLLWVLRSSGVDSLEKLRTVTISQSRADSVRSKLEGHASWPTGRATGAITAERFKERVTAAAVAAALNPDPPAVNWELKSFLERRGLPASAETVMADCGITTLAQFKRVKEAGDTDAALTALRQKLRDSGVPHLDRQVEEITPEEVQKTIAQVEAPDADAVADRAKQRTQQLKEAIAETEELRQAVASSAAAGATKIEAAVDKQLHTVLTKIGDVSGQAFADARTASATSTSELGTLLADTVAQATAFQNMLEGVDTAARTTATMIQAQDMLCGFLVSPAGAEMMSTPLVMFPDDVDDLVRDPGQIRSQTSIARGTSTSAEAMSLAEMSSSMVSTAFAVRGAKFVGAGMLSVSAAASYAQAGGRSTEEESFDAASANTWQEVQFSYVPKQVLQFDEDRLHLSSSARRAIEEIAGLPEDERRKRIIEFYEKYGSHFFTRCDVGGRYEFVSTGRAKTAEGKKKLITAVADATDWAASASASYSGLGGSISASASAQGSARSADATGSRLEQSSNDLDVSVAITVLGGGGIAPQSAWTESLRYPSTWRVIDRAQPAAAWGLVAGDSDLGAQVRGLASLMEEVWVRVIFLRAVQSSNPALYDAIMARPDVVTCAALDEIVHKREAELREMALDAQREPKLIIRVVAQKSPASPSPTAVASVEGREYKLIGGGAIAHNAGLGPFLTGSYPEGNAWVASAKDHLQPSKNDREGLPQGMVTAYAVYLVDPDDEWDVKMAKASRQGFPTAVSADLPEGYALTGGGGKITYTGAGRLLTGCYPKEDDHGRPARWEVHHRDWMDADHSGQTEAWVIGIRPRNGAIPRPSVIRLVGGTPGGGWMPATAGPSETPTDGTVVVGGGANIIRSDRAPALLTKNGFAPDLLRWEAEAKGACRYGAQSEQLPSHCDVAMYVISRPGTVMT